MNDIVKLPPWSDELGQIDPATGASSVTLREGLACLVEEALPHQLGLYKGRDVALAAMAEFAPRNGAEGLRAGLLVTIEINALDCLKRAQEFGLSPQLRDMSLRQTERLVNMSLRLQEAFERGRAPGQGNVSVSNRVNVEAGGQALVALQAPLPVEIGADGPTRASTEGGKVREKLPNTFGDARAKRPPSDDG